MTNKITTLGIILAIVLGGAALFTDKPVVVPVGAIPGDTVDGTNWNVGGVRTYSSSAVFTSASSSCVIAMPQASSTLIKYSARGRQGDNGATTVDVSYFTNAFATSSTAADSLFSGTAWASSGQFEVATAGSSTTVIPPTVKYVVLKVSSSTLSANYAPVGKCSIELQVL